jgi:signal transduction histidine kinase
MFGIFLIFAIYGMITFDLSIKEIQKLVGTRNEGFAFNIMQDLDQYIDKRLTDFKELTKLSTVQDALKTSNLEFRQIENLQKSIKEKNLETESDIELTPFIKNTKNEELSKELVETITFYKDEYGYDVVEELLITNEFGANVVLGSGTSESRHDNEEWWQEAKNTDLFVGELKYMQEYGSHATEFGYRIDDENGNFLGVMKVTLTLDDMLHDFINDAEITTIKNRNVLLLDNKGRIIFSNGIQDFQRSKPVPYFDLITNGKDVGTIELEGTPKDLRIISYAKSTGYKNFAGFDWVVLLDQTSSSFIDEFVELRNSILIMSIVGMVASVIVGIFVSFSITSPLKQLSDLSESISKGKFDLKVKKSRINEIEVIGKSFNKMAESLKKLIETEKQLAEAHVRIRNERLSTIGEIAASMAHNMKNPLGTIRSSAQIVQRNTKGKDKEIDEVLNRMDRAIEQMSRQIEDVLNFVRTTPLNVEVVSIRTLLDSAIESLEIPPNVTIELPQTDLKIKCDSKKIEIVFINLILNSIQAIGKNQGKVSIKVSKEGSFSIIEVTDTGSGILEEYLPKIFGPLVTTKEKGTGLGLSTCKNIVEQHGGSISVKNNPTTFTVKLPLNRE